MDNIWPSLSVVVPVYNTGLFLRNCLDSILEQTLRELEIILVDDGSNDALTLELLDEYQSKDSRIRLIRKDNGGQSTARNAGLHDARGRYVAFVDHDDILNRHMYEALFGEAEKNGVDVVECRFKPVSHDRVVTIDTARPPSAPFRMVSINQNSDFLVDHIQIWNRIYRTEFLRHHSLEFDDLLWEEDVLFSFKVLISAGSLSFLDEALYFHIEHDANTTHALGRKIFHAFKAHDLLLNFMNEKQCLTRYEESYVGRVLKDVLFGLNVIDSSCEQEFFREAHVRLKAVSLNRYSRFYSSSKKKLLRFVRRGDYTGFKRYKVFRKKRKYLVKTLFKITWESHEKSLTLLGVTLRI